MTSALRGFWGAGRRYVIDQIRSASGWYRKENGCVGAQSCAPRLEGKAEVTRTGCPTFSLACEASNEEARHAETVQKERVHCGRRRRWRVESETQRKSATHAICAMPMRSLKQKLMHLWYSKCGMLKTLAPGCTFDEINIGKHVRTTNSSSLPTIHTLSREPGAGLPESPQRRTQTACAGGTASTMRQQRLSASVYVRDCAAASGGVRVRVDCACAQRNARCRVRVARIRQGVQKRAR
eukprot:6198000-Pleurochrysis_carterae.AAC.1